MLSFHDVFYFFKRVAADSMVPPSFVARLRTAHDRIRARHGACACCWGLTNGLDRHWERIHPGDWPHWIYSCPYEVATAELELNWGCPDLVLNYRKAEDDRLHLITMSNRMYNAGLIRYTKGDAVTSEGYLYAQFMICGLVVNGSRIHR